MPISARGDGLRDDGACSVRRLPHIRQIHAPSNLLQAGWARRARCGWLAGWLQAISMEGRSVVRGADLLSEVGPLALMSTGASRLARSFLCTHRKLISTILTTCAQTRVQAEHAKWALWRFQGPTAIPNCDGCSDAIAGLQRIALVSHEL
jgi:hypothetical protein